MDDRWQASETLKDLLIERKRSRWPMVVGVTVVLMILTAGGAWFYLPPEQRPQLGLLKDRVVSFGNTLLNVPIMKAPGTSPSSGSPAAGKQPTSAPGEDDNSLLSNSANK